LEEATSYTKEVMSLHIKVNGDNVSFQITQFCKLNISHSDNAKLRKGRSKLMHSNLIVAKQWIRKVEKEVTRSEVGRIRIEIAGILL